MNYEIHKRIEQIRNDKKLSRAKFAERLDVSEGVIINIEFKRVETVKDLYIKLIANNFNVNEHWIRTGEGEMYSNSEIAETNNLYAALTDTKDPILENLIKNLLELPPKNIESLDDIVQSMVKTNNKKKR